MIEQNTLEFVRDGIPCFYTAVGADRVALLSGSTVVQPQVASPAQTADYHLWHRRLGHISLGRLKSLVEHHLVSDLVLPIVPSSVPVCPACMDGKQTRHPFPQTVSSRRSLPLELVHSDLHGPISVPTANGYRYWITFIDDASRYQRVWLLHKKSEAFSAFKQFKSWAEKQTGNALKALRDDKGGEYMSNEWEAFMLEHGIERQHTTRATPQQNGVAERTNRILDEGVASLLSDSHLPSKFWGEALSCFLHTLNRSPSSAVTGKTPFEAFYGQKPSVSHLRVFGCRAYAHVQRDKRTSFQPKSRKCIFLGYPVDYKGWKCWDPMTNQVFISRDVHFVETEMPGAKHFPHYPRYEPLAGVQPSSVGEPAGTSTPPTLSPSVPPVEPVSTPSDDSDSESGSNADPEDPPDLSSFAPPVSSEPAPDSAPAPSSSSPTPGPDSEAADSPAPPSGSSETGPPGASKPYVTRSGRSSRPMREWWVVPHPYQHAKEQRNTRHSTRTPESTLEADIAALETANAGRALSPSELIEYAFLTSTSEPRSYHEAMTRDDAQLWHVATEQEYNALQEHGAWELCELPPGRKAIGSRWVYKVKLNSDGSVERYKARLVAKGFSQKPHLDYTETFAPVAKFASLRTVLAIAAAEDMEIDHMDISTAFLNGDLDEEIYMAQPEGFAAPGQEHLVCCLKKSLYGLKQSPRQWYIKLHSTFVKLGFSRCASDHCVWIWAKDGVKVIIPAYVDDLIIACKNVPLLKCIKEELKLEYKVRDLGPVAYTLGIEIIRDRANRRLYLSQRKHIGDVLDRFNMADARPVSTPLAKSSPLTKEDCPQTPEDLEYMKSVPYLSAVGSLMYLSVGTRADISFAVGALSRFNANPGQSHWKQVQHVFKYLAGTKDLMLCYGPGQDSTSLQIYSDADYAGDVDSARSTSGHTVFIGKCLVNWSSKRQSVVAKSTTEAEYIAANEAGSDGVWFRNFMSELGYPPFGATTLWLDNQSAIRVGKNPEHHSRMRHLLPKYHWLREQVEDKVFSLEYVSTSLMRADVLTKPLETVAHSRVLSLLGLVSHPAL